MTQIFNYPVIDLILITYYKNMCNALEKASKDCIPSSKIDYHKEHVHCAWFYFNERKETTIGRFFEKNTLKTNACEAYEYFFAMQGCTLEIVFV